MSDITDFLYESVKQKQDAVTFGETYQLPPPIYAEFACDGKLNYARISTKYEVYCSFGEFLKAVEEVFGTLTFSTDPEAPSEITEDEFMSMYTFGLFKNVRDWQYAVYVQKNQYLALNDLFTWIRKEEYATY